MMREHRCQHEGCPRVATMRLDAETHGRVRWWCAQHVTDVTDVPGATGRAGVVRYAGGTP